MNDKTSIYNSIATTSRSNPAQAVPDSGKQKDLMDWSVRQAATGERFRPYDNVIYPGVVLYSSYLTESLFRSKYDPSFIEYIMATSTTTQVKSRIIIEAIAWIPDVCGFLPRPSDAKALEFFRELKKLTIKDAKDPKKSKSFDQIAKKAKDQGLSVKFLEKIKRYPRVYSVLRSDQTGMDVKLSSKIKVQFPYKFDIYAGKIISVEEK